MSDLQTEQLNLFEEPSNGVARASESALYADWVSGALKRYPKLYLGTSSWTFPGWKDLVYQNEYSPAELSRSGLAAYGQVPLFRTVSLDRTYYRPMTEPQYKQLAEQVGEGFRFVVKAPRELLQVGPTGFYPDQFSERFLLPAKRGLKHNLGVVLLQFPPGTRSEVGPGFAGHLERFLSDLPNDLNYSVEVRDEELLGPDLAKALHNSGVSLCASVHSSLPNPDQQLLRVPPSPDSDLVFRWNLRPSLDYKSAKDRFQPFNDLMSPDQNRRKLLCRLIGRALEAGRSVYMTANNKAEGCAPLSILKFLEELSS